MQFHESMLTLYYVAGSQNTDCDPKKFLTVLHEACEAGITMFQFREKGLGALIGEEKEHLAKAAFAITQRYGIPFIIDDDVDLALKIGADGVHIGQGDASLQEVVARCPHMIIGLSIHHEEEFYQSGTLTGVSYLGVGPVFPTTSKEDAKDAIGVEGIKHIATLSSIPMVAIGGIHHDNVKEVLSSPVAGVAVISEIANASNIQEAVLGLKKPSHSILTHIRQSNPVVLNVANSVTQQYVADAISYIGGSPIMFESPEDGKELAQIAGAITLNMGTPNPTSLEKSIAIGKIANERSIPVLLDPVAVGATSVRVAHTAEVLKRITVSLIRGNRSEIAAIAGIDWSGKGIDAEKEPAYNIEGAIEIATMAAKKTGATIILSGEVDVVTDGHTIYTIANGNSYLTVNVGAGDMLDAIIATAAAIDSSLETIAYATSILSIAADIAIEKTEGKPYTFFHEVWNTLGTMTDKDIIQRIHIQQHDCTN